MGVVVQELVEADTAGVLFTRNPLNGRDEVVIEAARGFGEAVVAGLVTPDRFRKNWSANLARVPDLRWELLDACFTSDAAWCEWRWHGTRLGGGRFDVQSV